MRRINFMCTVLACMMLLLTSFALAGEKKQKLYPIHPVVGDVIDAEENEKYNLCGPLEGFIAARF